MTTFNLKGCAQCPKKTEDFGDIFAQFRQSAISLSPIALPLLTANRTVLSGSQSATLPALPSDKL
jgi:hypothetical protein